VGFEEGKSLIGHGGAFWCGDICAGITRDRLEARFVTRAQNFFAKFGRGAPALSQNGRQIGHDFRLGRSKEPGAPDGKPS
jgi:hypothetical protein